MNKKETGEYSVYSIIHAESGKCYIGLSKNLGNRFKQHKNNKTPLGDDIRKYGRDRFKMEMLVKCHDKSQGLLLEKFFVNGIGREIDIPLDGFTLNTLS